MSERGWALGLLLVALARSLPAQDAGLARLQFRADSLAREWREALAIAELVDSLERARAVAGRDTIAVGSLRIVTNPSPLPVREAAARAWLVLDSLYGPVAERLAAHPYVIRAVDPDTSAPRSALHVGRQVPWNLEVEALTVLLLLNVPMPRPDAALGDWLGAIVQPSGGGLRDRAAVYVQLVTVPSQAARSCFLGDLAACRDALSLGERVDPLERWYPSPAERRALITRWFAPYFDRGGNERAFRACTAGDDGACADLLRTLPTGAFPPPLGSAARATIVHTALRLGGREAYRRLLADSTAPLAHRLAAAAGVPFDSLLGRWRTEVVTARPVPVALPSWALAVAIGWTVVFAICGMRSSRWRVA